MIDTNRKLLHLSKKLKEWKEKLIHAITIAEIGFCLKMIRNYEDAIIALER